jgi:hypothetical protein
MPIIEINFFKVIFIFPRDGKAAINITGSSRSRGYFLGMGKMLSSQ